MDRDSAAKPDPDAATSMFSAARAMRSRPATTSPIWEDPTPANRNILRPLAAVPAAAPARASYDDRLLAILLAPLAPGETASVGFRRKEAELATACAALAILDARELHARLLACKAGDALAAAFGRLTEDRRHRLIAFLADARRRAAIAMARR